MAKYGHERNGEGSNHGGNPAEGGATAPASAAAAGAKLQERLQALSPKSLPKPEPDTDAEVLVAQYDFDPVQAMGASASRGLALSAGERIQLLPSDSDWLFGCKVGNSEVRGVFPKSWAVSEKAFKDMETKETADEGLLVAMAASSLTPA